MNYFGKVFVEYQGSNNWNLSTVNWWQYLITYAIRVYDSPISNRKDYDYHHGPRKNARFV